MTRYGFALCWIAFLTSSKVWGGESVLFSVTQKGITVSATNRASKEGLPVDETKTEIFAINLETGTKRLVFSDEKSNIVLLPEGGARAGIVTGGGKVFAVAMDRQEVANAHGTSAVYELSTDGSGRSRKIFEVDNFAHLFVNPSGSEIGYMPGDTTETHIVIRDTASTKLLRQAELFRRTIEAESVSRIDWMPDGKAIYFALAGGLDDEETLWSTPNSPIGTYLMNEDSGSVERLAPEAALHPKISGLQPLPDAAAVLIGRLADGSYFLSDTEYDATSSRQIVHFYALDLSKRTQKLFHFQRGDNPHLAPSGDKVVLTISPENDQKQPTFKATSTVDIWVMELGSGRQAKLFSFSAPDVTNAKGPWMNLIGWLQEQ